LGGRGSLVIRDAKIADADGVREGDILVVEGVIERVGEVAEDELPEIPAKGRCVTPGLVDCHVHFVLDGGPDPLAINAKSDIQLGIEAVNFARNTLMGGITTVRDIGGRNFVETHLRNAINAGTVPGPRTLTAGQFITMTGGHAHYMGREADGMDDCRKAAREQLKMGVDWLKVMATGGVLTPGVDPRAAQFTEEEIRAVVEEGLRAGRGTAAHAHGSGGIQNAVRAGVKSVEHATYMDEASADLMAEKKIYWVPTVKALEDIMNAGTEKGIPEWAVKKGEDAGDSLRKSFDRALERGISIAMGTDAGTPFNLHGENARELEWMVEYGMEPVEAVRAATTSAARLLGLQERIGLVREGMEADLLILGRNPLDDVSAYRTSLEKVIQAGTVVRG
jgi:imidazolonepropionase-like amidohydrolase